MNHAVSLGSLYHISLVFKSVLIVFATCLQYSHASDIPSPTRTLPKLQHLSKATDTTHNDSTRISSLDSAVIVMPPKRIILTATTTPITVVAKCQVDSVTIFVRHSGLATDTIARLHTPPFTTSWNYASLPDQDQLHLQFGYVLHTSAGNTITSKALPHNWLIDRSTKLKKKRYHCKQTLTPDTIIVDGSLDEWKHGRFSQLGSAGTFAFTWTTSALYFAARINDDTITTADYVEIHLDPFYTRSPFSDTLHRSIRLSPTSRSYIFTACRSEDLTTYMQCDSIVSLLSEGIVWRTTTTDNGYILEASLPFYALSNRDFPRLQSGMDISCKTGKNGNYVSWAGGGDYNRYNPSEWGTLVLHQAMFPLKLTLFISAAILGFFVVVVVIKFVHHFYTTHRMEQKEHQGDSPHLLKIRTYVDTNIANSSITIETAATHLQLSADILTVTLQNELECDFSQFLVTRRINKAKNDLWNFTLPLETVATNAGFKTLNEMEELFLRQLHTDPVRFRMMADAMASDEDDTNHSDQTGSPESDSNSTDTTP